jgi:ATP-dependent protease ClpP protease subunit
MALKGRKGYLITSEVRSGVAYIRIVDAINEYGEASAAVVRLQVDSFLSQGITKAEVYTNSRGGDCFEATEIANELERFGNENVSLKVGALAASAATFLLAKFKSVANPNSQIMIHMPSLGTYGNIASIESDLVLLRNTTAIYKTAYAAKTGKTEEEIETLWSKGDVWLTAAQALELKLIDGITGDEELEITAEVRTILEACGAPVIPDLTTKQTDDTMKRELIIAALGLAADATDEQIETALKAAKEKADMLDGQQETAATKAEKDAKTLVAKHLNRKVIKADMVETYESWAKVDLEGCKMALEAMTPIPKLSAELKGNGHNEPNLEARSGWTYDKWMEEDPKGLEALADTNTEEFNRLFNSNK